MSFSALCSSMSLRICRCVLTVSPLYRVFYSAQPPLIQAIFSGDPEEIRMLIYKSEDINALVRTQTRAHAHTPKNAAG